MLSSCICLASVVAGFRAPHITWLASHTHFVFGRCLTILYFQVFVTAHPQFNDVTCTVGQYHLGSSIVCLHNDRKREHGVHEQLSSFFYVMHLPGTDSSCSDVGQILQPYGMQAVAQNPNTSKRSKPLTDKQLPIFTISLLLY